MSKSFKQKTKDILEISSNKIRNLNESANNKIVLRIRKISDELFDGGKTKNTDLSDELSEIADELENIFK
jgi:hypothetical protein